MNTDLKVSSYVIIGDDCPMRFRVNDYDDVEFGFGSERDPFEFVFHRESLRKFIILGSEALCEMDALREKT
jgi:hypothetical protein